MCIQKDRLDFIYETLGYIKSGELNPSEPDVLTALTEDYTYVVYNNVPMNKKEFTLLQRLTR